MFLWYQNDYASQGVAAGQLAARGQINNVDLYVNGSWGGDAPFYAWPGDSVDVRVDVENTGDYGDIAVTFSYPWLVGPEATQTATLALSNGDVGTAHGTFAMPQQAAVVDVTVGNYLYPDDWTKVTVSIEPTPLPVITGISAPAEADPDTPVDFVVNVKNNGMDGYIGAYYYALDGDAVVVATESAFASLPAGGTYGFAFQFQMPDTDATIYASSYFWRDGVPASGPP